LLAPSRRVTTFKALAIQPLICKEGIPPAMMI
jgi:hypothetical protein